MVRFFKWRRIVIFIVRNMWQGSQTIEKGYAPAVALTDNGRVVVVYENNKFTTYKTYYCLGIVDFDSKTIRWTVQREPYGSGGQNLSISMNNDGTIVEVHRSTGPQQE